jgi:radical SAM protein with 4Fe4S-binding SPASM domain
MPLENDFESRGLPNTFVLELTRCCNNFCLYCYAAQGPLDRNPEPCGSGEMGTEEILGVISRLCDQLPVENIALSGGEPLLRGDLPQILTFLRSRHINPVIITNGTLLTKENVAATVAGVTYEITLLSYREGIHDHLSGRRGAWEAVIDGMCNVRQAGGAMVAVFVATKLNYMDLHQTVQLAIALGASGLMYNRMNLGSRNMRWAEKLLPTPNMIQENLDVLEEASKQYGLPIAVSVPIQPCVVDVRRYKHIGFGWCPLAGEESYFTIDPSGNIRICNHSPVVLGNIRHQSFVDIYYKHPYVKRFHQTCPAECQGCTSDLKQVCYGGCKAAAEQCYGTPERADPFVILNSVEQVPS